MLGRYIDLGNPVADHPLNVGLLSWWLPLPNNQGGGTFFDLVKRCNGSLANGPAWSSNCLTFDGSDDVVDLGTVPRPNVDACTIELVAWFNSTTVQDVFNLKGHTLGNFRGIGGSFSHWQWLNFHAPGASSGSGFSNTQTFELNTKVHIVGTYDGATSSLYVTSDYGHFSATNATTGALDWSFDSGSSMMNRTTAVNPNVGTAGRIYSVRWYERAFSEAMSLVLYEQYRRDYPNTLRRWSRKAWLFGTTGGGGGTAFNRSLSDSLGHTDAFSRLASHLRIHTESQGHTDAYDRLSDALRVLSDNQGHTDAYARLSDALRAYADNQGHTDTYTRLSNALRIYSDNQGHSDAYSRLSNALRAYADNQGHSDAFSRLSDALRTLADSTGVTDAYQRISDANRDFEDLLALADAATLDLVSAGVLTLAVVESLGLSDAYQRLSDGLRTVSDTAGASDAHQRISDALRDFTDTLGITDTATLQLIGGGVLLIAVAEMLGISDAFQRTAASQRAVSDMVGTAEAYARQADALRILTETAGISEAYARISSASRALAETLGLADDATVTLIEFVLVAAVIAFDIRFSHVQADNIKLPHVQAKDPKFSAR